MPHQSKKEITFDEYPFRELPYKSPSVNVEVDEDNNITLTSSIPMGSIEKSIPHLFKRKAAIHPNRVWLGEKDSVGQWVEICYRDFDERSDRIAQWLINEGMGQDTPLMILSENSIAHALMAMGALKAQVPVAPISAAYSLMDPTFTKLKKVVDILKPTLLFAQCGNRFGAAIAALEQKGRRFIVSDNVASDHIVFDVLSSTTKNAQLDDVMAGIAPSTVAKYIFTSGSTGSPKCVVQTQHILCAQVAGLRALRHSPDDSNISPVSLQWMPWSHVSGGNISYHEAILMGGAIYIDDGRPMPGLFEKTIDNLRQLSTTVFGSAPIGLSWLVTALENDTELQRVFFKKLEAITYGGAALPDDVRHRIQKLAIANTGKKIPIISMYGSTETQGITATYWPTDFPGAIGLPMPGTEVKLVPCGNKLEVRVKAPTVLKKYYNEPALTADSFDDQGYFKLGDAAKFAVEDKPLMGLVFDGRINEDFKLLSGTWVSTSTIKGKLLKALGRLIRDLVVCGENKHFVSVFAWLDKDATAEFVGDKSADITQLISNSKVESYLEQQLNDYNAQNPGSSARVKKIMILKENPSLARSEINEKGYINTNALISNRHELFEHMYSMAEGKSILNDLIIPSS